MFISATSLIEIWIVVQSTVGKPCCLDHAILIQRGEVGVLFELFPDLWLAPVLATFLWSLVIGAASWALVFKTSIFDRYVGFKMESVLCTMLNLIFVFFMAFMGSDFHENHTKAYESLIKEKAALNGLANMELPSPEMTGELRKHIKNYLDGVITQEWLIDFNQTESPQVSQEINAMAQLVLLARKRCVSGTGLDCIDPIVAASYLQHVSELRQARDYRLAIGSLERQTLRYLLCVFLAFLSTVSLMVLLRRDARAAVAPLVLYCTSLWVAFLIVVLHAEPYVGIRGVKPLMLESVLKALP